MWSWLVLLSISVYSLFRGGNCSRGEKPVPVISGLSALKGQWLLDRHWPWWLGHLPVVVLLNLMLADDISNKLAEVKPCKWAPQHSVSELGATSGSPTLVKQLLIRRWRNKAEQLCWPVELGSVARDSCTVCDWALFWCFTPGAQSWNELCASWGALWLWTVGASRKSLEVKYTSTWPCVQVYKHLCGWCHLQPWLKVASSGLWTLAESAAEWGEIPWKLRFGQLCCLSSPSTVSQVGACGCCWARPSAGAAWVLTTVGLLRAVT